MDALIKDLYGNRTRIRVCGLCWQGNHLLLVNHEMYPGASFWSPPGGGIEFGHSMEEALQREFMEETNLAVRVGKFRFIAEVVRPPLHAIEVFFDATVLSGTLSTGYDPEMTSETQIIRNVSFLDWAEIEQIPGPEKHGIFSRCTSADDLRSLSGLYKI
jgi:8-oxo-dGTP diphosphatase